jgi:hypothetical protein
MYSFAADSAGSFFAITRDSLASCPRELDMTTALPLVAMHAPEECEEQADISAESEKTDTTAQKPFQNLRDMMRKR